jgi:uncharacterized protein YcbK (DUF882 family)
MSSIAPAFSPVNAAPYVPINGATDDAYNDASGSATRAGMTPFAGVLANHMKPTTIRPAEESAPEAGDPPTDGEMTASTGAGDASARAAAPHTPTADDPAPPLHAHRRAATAALKAMVEQVADATAAPAASALTDAEEKSTAAVGAAEKHAGTAASGTDDAAATADASGFTSLTARAASDALRRAADVNPALNVRDTQAIDPALKAKVDRVIARRKEETGHDVTIVEGWRSQARQDALHAQGRTTAGPVVTWTRHSRHTEGEAVDVMIDGKFDNPEAFAKLQQIAGEEGLHTLGARDPGHLELVSAKGLTQMTAGVSIAGVQLGASGDSTTAASTRQSPRDASAAPVAQIAQLASVAAPAQVAAVATVAAVAAVASVASSGLATTGVTAPVARVTAAVNQQRVAPTADDAVSGDGKRSARNARSAREGAVLDALAAARSSVPRDSADARLAIDPTSRLTGSSGMSVPTAARGVDAGARVAQVFGLQDAKAAQPMSSLLLRLDNGAGGEDRIRVDLRGTTVGASIDMRDADAAQQLAKNLPDLTRSLEARGLDTGALRVRAVAAAGLHDEGLMRTTTVNTEAGRTRAETLATASGSSTRASRDDAQQDGPKHQPSRQRSRRDQKGEEQ